MNDEELDSLTRKHLMRGAIMTAATGLVKTAADAPAIVPSFHRIVTATQTATLAQVQQQVDYLVAAGYLEPVTERRAARDEARIVGYRPTVKGIQLAEGDIADETVEFKSL